MSMKIREPQLYFSTTLRVRETTRRIFIHHTASKDVTVETVHRWHLNKPNWGGIGYHYLIRQNGAVERGRPEDAIGVHTRGNNSNSIGIALAGNFSVGVPTDKQIDSLVRLIFILRGRYGVNLPVLRHSDRVATQCPGTLFPWGVLQKRIA